MFDDCDPRDADACDRDDGIRDREEEWLVRGRGPGSAAVGDDPMQPDTGDRNEDGRDDRDRETRDRDDEHGHDPRDVFMRDLDLPDGRERELALERDREYTLSGSDTRALSTIGAFRVVPERDLRDPRDATCDTREDLRHLEKQGLIERVALDGRDRAVVLTDRGRDLLEHHGRDRDDNRGQTFYAGADRARERTHDAALYRAYLKEAERLREQDARILRVQLDRELKREYNASSRNAIRAIATATDARTEAATRSRPGRTSTTCRTRTSTSASPTCASSTKTRMATSATAISRSRPSTTAAPTPHPSPDPARRGT